MFLPWWLTLLLFLVGAYLYAPWYELLVAAFFLDIFFSLGREFWHGFQFVYTLFAIASILIFWILKKYILTMD